MSVRLSSLMLWTTELESRPKTCLTFSSAFIAAPRMVSEESAVPVLGWRLPGPLHASMTVRSRSRAIPERALSPGFSCPPPEPISAAHSKQPARNDCFPQPPKLQQIRQTGIFRSRAKREVNCAQVIEAGWLHIVGILD